MFMWHKCIRKIVDFAKNVMLIWIKQEVQLTCASFLITWKGAHPLGGKATEFETLQSKNETPEWRHN